MALHVKESLNLENAQPTKTITSGKMNIKPRILPETASSIILGSVGVIMYWLNQLKVIAMYVPESIVVMVRSVSKTESAIFLKSLESATKHSTL